MSLDDLTVLLDAYARGAIGLEAVHTQLLPILVADPLDVEASDGAPWDDTHSEARLFWRLIHLFESELTDGDAARRAARRAVACLRQTRSAETAFELLPLLLDQDRFVEIVARHSSGIISRTGLLSIIAESGYPAHVKLWLEHAGIDALARVADWLADERYDAVSLSLEVPPG